MPSEAEVYESYSDTGEDEGQEKQVSSTTLLKLFGDAYRGAEDYRRGAVELLQMMNNDQWPDEIKAQLPENMNPIVINKMLMPIMFLSGVQRQTRQEAKLLPFEGGDLVHAQIMNSLLHWVLTQENADEKDSRVFLDKEAIGMGWWKVTQDFESDDPEGRIAYRRLPALRVFADPNWLEGGDWNDAQYVFDAQWLTPDEASEQWPEYEDKFKTTAGEWLKSIQGTSASQAGGNIAELVGDAFSAERLFWDPLTKRIRVLECWKKHREQVTIAFNQETSSIIAQPEKVKMIQQAIQGQQSPYVFLKKTVTLIRMAHLFIDTVLDDEASPYEASTFPIFPSLGYYFWKEPFGLAHLMRDLQWEKNKRRSKIIDMVGRMPLSGFFNKRVGGADPKEIENYGNGNGVVINYDSEEPKKIAPPDLPMSLVHLEDAADKEMREVTNVHDELLGQATQKTISGKAIEARQRGGLVSHESMFDSFRQEKIEVIRFVIAMIKQFLSPTKALRILGQVAQRQPDSEMGQMMQQAQQDPLQGQTLMETLGEVFDVDYDVVISSRPAEPSLAMQAWESLSEMNQQSPGSIPPQVLFNAAAKAGILTEEDVQQILAYYQQQQAAQQQATQAPAPGGASDTGAVAPAQATPQAGVPPA